MSLLSAINTFFYNGLTFATSGILMTRACIISKGPRDDEDSASLHLTWLTEEKK